MDSSGSDTDKCQAPVEMIMILRLSQNSGKFLISWNSRSINFSIMIVLNISSILLVQLTNCPLRCLFSVINFRHNERRKGCIIYHVATADLHRFHAIRICLCSSLDKYAFNNCF
jgi:hypothetical protein